MKAHRGFTLIEVIVGVSLTAVLVMIVFSSLRLGQRAQEKAIERQDISQKMRILSDRLAWLIHGAYPYTVGKDAGAVIYFKGEADELGFVTTSTDPYSKEPEDMEGLKWVKLFVDSDGLKIKENVYFHKDALEDGDGREYLFDPDVRSMEFEYLDTGEDEGEGKWTDSWSPREKAYLPSAVRVVMVFEYRGKEIEMPPVIAAIRAGGLRAPAQ